jgi:hypothetical protein
VRVRVRIRVRVSHDTVCKPRPPQKR